MEEYDSQYIRDCYEHSLKQITEFIGGLQKALTNKYVRDFIIHENAAEERRIELTETHQKNIKIWDDQLQSFEKALEQTFTFPEDSLDDSDSSTIVDGAEQSSTDVLQNSSNDSNLQNNSTTSDHETSFGSNMNENVEDEESRIPRLKEKFKKQKEQKKVPDGKGYFKKKCLFCKKVVSVQNFSRHEASCWQKNGGQSSFLYVCKFENCKYVKPKCRHSLNVVKQHIKKKHGISEANTENYIMKMKNPVLKSDIPNEE